MIIRSRIASHGTSVVIAKMTRAATIVGVNARRRPGFMSREAAIATVAMMPTAPSVDASSEAFGAMRDTLAILQIRRASQNEWSE
jgi:hypothetical protein